MSNPKKHNDTPKGFGPKITIPYCKHCGEVLKEEFGGYFCNNCKSFVAGKGVKLKAMPMIRFDGT